MIASFLSSIWSNTGFNESAVIPSVFKSYFCKTSLTSDKLTHSLRAFMCFCIISDEFGTISERRSSIFFLFNGSCGNLKSSNSVVKQFLSLDSLFIESPFNTLIDLSLFFTFTILSTFLKSVDSSNVTIYSLSNTSLTFPVTSNNSSESLSRKHTLTLEPLPIFKLTCCTLLASKESPTEKFK